MSDSNRRGAIAVVLGVIFLGLFLGGWWLSGEAVKYSLQQQAEAADRTERTSKQCYSVASLSLCFTGDDSARAEAERSEKDLKAQEGMVFWAIWISVFTGGQIGVGTIGAYFLIRSFRQNAEQLDLARRAYQAEYRPWLPLNVEMENPETFYRGARYFRFLVTAKHTGNSAAKGVRFNFMPHEPEGNLTPSLWADLMERSLDQADPAYDDFVSQGGEFSIPFDVTVGQFDVAMRETEAMYVFTVIAAFGLRYVSVVEEDVPRYSITVRSFEIRTRRDGLVTDILTYPLPGGSRLT